MELLNELVVFNRDEPKYIRLYHGDLTDKSEATDADLIVVSAWQGNYSPVPKTLVAALDKKGLSVAKLASDKEEDLRDAFNSWLSRKLPHNPELPDYKRLFCFEPPNEAPAHESVGDIFQGLMPFIAHPDYAINSIAMPLVAAGNRGAAAIEILEATLEAAVQWLVHGFPVSHIHIVEFSAEKAHAVNGAFEILKRQYLRFSKPKRRFKYDLFVSYSHDDTKEVMAIVDTMIAKRPDLEIFLDRQDLSAGSVWQQALYDALDNCEKVLAFYSPTYLSSKVCKEEFNIAVFRHRDSEHGVLVPVYIFDTALPTYMKLIQFIDARSLVPDKPEEVAESILKGLI
jgi:hypothetical protein